MIRALFFQIKDGMKQRVDALTPHLSMFGWFLFLSSPIFYYVYTSFEKKLDYENFFLRLSISLIGLLLIFHHRWPKFMKALLPYIIYVTLFYALVFFNLFMLFQNDFSSVWQLNATVGIFFLYIFLGWVQTILFAFLGFFLAWFVASLVSVIPEMWGNFWYVLLSYAYFFIFIILFSKQKEFFQLEKLQSMKALAGAIAHEMRTPLFSMMGEARWLKKILPKLVQMHAQAAQTGSPESTLVSSKDLTILQKVPDNIETTARDAFTIIEMFLVKLKDKSPDITFETTSMHQCIQEVLQTYPLTEEERSLILCQGEGDFLFRGNPLLMRHVFYNLLKNALYYIKEAQKGQIFIVIEPGSQTNKVYFKDTGKGIPSALLPHIFKRFYSKTNYGTGIGLAFCQTVMQGVGGEITCHSVEGEFTEFILSFPPLKQD
jgi:signal transduction histidine kinase